jgi:hypothetical protein
MAEILTQRKGIGFNMPSASPLGLYVDATDKLQWKLFGSAKTGRFYLRGRLINAKGELVIINEVLDITLDNYNPSKVINLEEGFLQCLTVRPASGLFVSLGQVFTIVSLVRGTEAGGEYYESMTLIQNYVSSSFYPSYPTTQLIDPLIHEGYKVLWVVETFSGAPMVSWGVPNFAYYRLVYIYFQVSTSSVANNRYYNIFVDDEAGNTIFATATRSTVPASTIAGFIFGIGENAVTDQLGREHNSLPSDIIMKPNYKLYFRQYNYDAGDTITIRVIVERRMVLL